MIGGLEQADAGECALLRPVERGEHQSPAHPRVLHRRIDGDGAEAGDGGALVEDVAPDDAPVELGDDAVKARVRERARQDLDGVLGGHEVRGKAVTLGDAAEGRVADAAARLGVSRGAGSQPEIDDRGHDWPLETGRAYRSG